MARDEKFWAYAALISVCFFWGTTYFGIRIAVHYLPPLFLAGMRHLLAGSIFCIYFMGIKGERLPDKKVLLKMFITGLFLIFGANVLVSYAEKTIPSGLAALICSFLPFYILIINWVSGNKEKTSLLSTIGLIIGVLGMLVIFYDNLVDILNGNYLAGIILILLANMSWAYGTIYSKKAEFKTHPLFSSGLQMLIMGITISIVSFLNGDFQRVQFTTSGMTAFFYLVIFGSIVGFGSFTYANAKLPSGIISIYAYINPIVAVVLGSVFLQEKISMYIIAGMILTLVGVYLVNKGYQQNVKKNEIK
jgi:drug/metabolite transporter (DMT)-like permease